MSLVMMKTKVMMLCVHCNRMSVHDVWTLGATPWMRVLHKSATSGAHTSVRYVQSNYAMQSSDMQKQSGGDQSSNHHFIVGWMLD